MNIRAVYGTPCRSQYFCKRSNVSGTVDVRVRHVTTMGTNETLFPPLPQFVAYRARLARVCRIHVIHGYADRLRLVGYKVLQLSPSPSVQPCAHSFPGFNTVTNIRKVFETNLVDPARNRFSNNSFGDCVIYMRDMPTFLARDFTKTLLCASGTVGLKTPTMSEIGIPIMPQFSTIKHSATGSGRDVILPNVATHNAVSGGWVGIRDVEDQIKVPLAFFADKLCFGWASLKKKIGLMFAERKRNLLAPRHGEQRQNITFDTIRSFIEMYGLRFKADQWNRNIFFDALVGLQRFVCACDLMDDIASHLTTQGWVCGAHGCIRKIVQSYSVPAAMLLSKRHNSVASRRKSFGKVSEGLRLFFGVNQLGRYSALHI